LPNLGKSLCNCRHSRSTSEKCCLAIKIRDFSYSHNFFFEMFLLRSVGLGIFTSGTVVLGPLPPCLMVELFKSPDRHAPIATPTRHEKIVHGRYLEFAGKSSPGKKTAIGKNSTVCENTPDSRTLYPDRVRIESGSSFHFRLPRDESSSCS
jgi:hypothetical protein